MGEDEDCHYQQRAEAAMRKAAGAACAHERHAWVQAALLWQLLGRGLALETTIAPALVPSRLTGD
jgi:hypothetical protein